MYIHNLYVRIYIYIHRIQNMLLYIMTWQQMYRQKVFCTCVCTSCRTCMVSQHILGRAFCLMDWKAKGLNKRAISLAYEKIVYICGLFHETVHFWGHDDVRIRARRWNTRVQQQVCSSNFLLHIYRDFHVSSCMTYVDIIFSRSSGRKCSERAHLWTYPYTKRRRSVIFTRVLMLSAAANINDLDLWYLVYII